MNVTQEKQAVILRGALVAGMIALAAASRIVAHPWNLTPVGAMALFSGAMVRNRWMAVLLPLACLFAGDIFVGFYKLMIVVYMSFAISVAIGRWLGKSRTVGRIVGAVFLGALQFFVITNFAVWAISGYYPKTVVGLATCFANGVPYFWNTIGGDGLYAGILFGGFALAEKMVPALRSLESRQALAR